jgi:hypothetical protein
VDERSMPYQFEPGRIDRMPTHFGPAQAVGRFLAVRWENLADPIIAGRGKLDSPSSTPRSPRWEKWMALNAKHRGWGIDFLTSG